MTLVLRKLCKLDDAIPNRNTLREGQLGRVSQLAELHQEWLTQVE